MSKLRELLLGLRPTAGQTQYTEEQQRSVGDVDAATAARTQHEMSPLGDAGGVPPGYVKSYDEGRPPH